MTVASSSNFLPRELARQVASRSAAAVRMTGFVSAEMNPQSASANASQPCFIEVKYIILPLFFATS